MQYCVVTDDSVIGPFNNRSSAFYYIGRFLAGKPAKVLPMVSPEEEP